MFIVAAPALTLVTSSRNGILYIYRYFFVLFCFCFCIFALLFSWSLKRFSIYLYENFGWQFAST